MQKEKWKYAEKITVKILPGLAAWLKSKGGKKTQEGIVMAALIEYRAKYDGGNR